MPVTSRRLAVFVGSVFGAESAFFAVVPPLVPQLVRDVHLTTTEVGILVAAYPAGVLLAAIPSMALVDRRGVRMATVVGIAVLIASTLGFGWGMSPYCWTPRGLYRVLAGRSHGPAPLHG